MLEDLTKELVVERYKFIQDKQKHLDSQMNSNVSLLVKIVVGTFSLVFAVFSTHLKQPDVISLPIATLVLKLSLIFIFAASSILLLITISNIFSWFGYRKDEVKLLNKFGGSFQRENPKLSNFLVWQETWFVFTLLLIIIIATFSWAERSFLISRLIIN